MVAATINQIGITTIEVAFWDLMVCIILTIRKQGSILITTTEKRRAKSPL